MKAWLSLSDWSLSWSLVLPLVWALPLAAAGAAQAQPRSNPRDGGAGAGSELTPAALAKALAGKPTGAGATELGARIRAWFGEEDLASGHGAKIEGQDVAFAILAPNAKEVSARSIDNFLEEPLLPVGTTGIWAGVATLSDGTAARFQYQVDGRRLGRLNVETYTIHPESLPQRGVPKGRVLKQPPLESKVFAGTTRDWWIYVPAQYRAKKPAAVMVFQDGERHYLPEVPTVFDNLIHKGDMPVTAAVFLNPGVFADGKRNRSVEYDTLSDAYARFVLEEVFPRVEKVVRLRKDPASRAIGGLSSGGICAFTAAWHKPDQFGKVLSWIGSFTNIASGASGREGGHNYPALIRREPRKPIRVFLQDGDQDQDQRSGSWPLGNLAMERALTFARYDFRMVWGHGFHSPRHGTAILPDSLRWLWRDHKTVQR